MRKAAGQRREQREEKRQLDRQQRQERPSREERKSELERPSREERQTDHDTSHVDKPAAEAVRSVSPIAALEPVHSKLPSELWVSVLALLAARDLSACACTSASFAELAATDDLWQQLHLRLFGALPEVAQGSEEEAASDEEEAEVEAAEPGAAEPPAASGSSSLPTAALYESEVQASGSTALFSRLTGHRRRVCASECALDAWRQPARGPRELPLPDMTAVCLAGPMGVSVHEGPLLRLWEVESGRRLACRKLRPGALRSCDAAGGFLAIGDGSGVQVFDLEEGIDRPMNLGGVPANTVSVAVAAVEDGCVVVSGNLGGHVAAVRLVDEADAPPTANILWSVDALDGQWPVCRGRCFGVAAGGSYAYATDADRAVQFDLYTGQVLWNGYFSHGEFDEVDFARLSLADQVTGAPGRRASYSPGWRLLAGMATGGVALWDTREVAPVARICVPRAASVHLDSGGAGGAGHLLVSGEGSDAVLVYDIRRLAGARRQDCDCYEQLAPVGRVPCPSRERADVFAADASCLVVGGSKAPCAFRWRVAAGAADEIDEADEGEQSAAGTPGQKKGKPRRQAKNLVRRPCRLANR